LQLVNHTLSQSVTSNIVTAVSATTKLFVGDIIDRARQVQIEWQAASTHLPTGEVLHEDAPLADRTQDCDRGPLTPDHLREALRRYKKERSGGSAGFLGLSLHGKDVVNARMGGRRLFR
jgi:transcription initiation factor TFIID subunit 11